MRFSMTFVYALALILLSVLPARAQVAVDSIGGPVQVSGGSGGSTDASTLTEGQLPVGRLTDFLANANTWAAKQRFFEGDGSAECNSPFIDVETGVGDTIMAFAANNGLLNVCRNGAPVAQFTTIIYATNGLEVRGSGGVNLANGTGGILMTEQSDPDAPGGDGAKVYFKDNGAGKTQLCVRFSSGSPVCSAELIQP